MQFELEHVMGLPVERVYPYIADPRNRPKWQRTIREFQMISDGEPGLGTRWREKAIAAPEFEIEIIAFEPNRVWAERGTSPHVTGELWIRFESEGDSTRLKIRVEAELKGWRRIAALVFPFVVGREVRGDLERAETLIRKHVELEGRRSREAG